MGSAFATWAVMDGTILRAQVGADNKRGKPEVHIPHLVCTPLLPVDHKLALLAGIDAPSDKLATFIEGDYDIMRGDYLSIKGQDMNISGYGEYPSMTNDVKMAYIIVDKIKAPRT